MSTQQHLCDVRVLLFADDIALVADSPEELQAMLDVVSKHAHAKRYTLAPKKSNVCVYEPIAVVKARAAKAKREEKRDEKRKVKRAIAAPIEHA